jgi:hypothetical protein
MKPGTNHYVVTTEDCLAVGGHFYNQENFGHIALGIIHQHFLGVVTLNNTEHSEGAVILFSLRLVHQHYQCCPSHIENNELQNI